VQGDVAAGEEFVPYVELLKKKIEAEKFNYTNFFRSSMVLQPFVGPWPLLLFRNPFVTQTVGLLARGISPSQGRYLHRRQHKHRINAHTDIHASSGIRTHDPSVRVSEDSSYLRPRGH
jgi:hypothetical protein